MKTKYLLFMCLFGSACGNAKEETKSVDSFYKKYKNAIETELGATFASGRYDWIFHLHFRGNDFGSDEGKETVSQLAPLSTSPILNKAHPLRQLVLNHGDEALDIRFNYKRQEILGSLIYRYKSEDRAFRAVQSLFGCKAGDPQGLNRVYMVGSGGSHGAYELQSFHRRLRDECGKEINYMVFGDAIAQPMTFAMSKIKGMASSQGCLNFFQSNFFEFLKGTSIDQCLNVRITGSKDARHDRVEQSGKFLMADIFEGWDTN